MEPAEAGLSQRMYTDLLTETPVEVQESGGWFSCALAPGQVRCLSPDPADLELLKASPPDAPAVPPRIEHQQLSPEALQVFTSTQSTQDIGGFDADRAAAGPEERPRPPSVRSSTPGARKAVSSPGSGRGTSGARSCSRRAISC